MILETIEQNQYAINTTINGVKVSFEGTIPETFSGEGMKEFHNVAIELIEGSKNSTGQTFYQKFIQPKPSFDGEVIEPSRLEGPISHFINGGYSSNFAMSISLIDLNYDNSTIISEINNYLPELVKRVVLFRELESAIRSGESVEVNTDLVLDIFKDITNKLSDVKINGVNLSDKNAKDSIPHMRVRADEVVHWLEMVKNAEKNGHTSIDIELGQDENNTVFSVRSSGGTPFPSWLMRDKYTSEVNAEGEFQANQGNGTALLARDLEEWFGTIQMESSFIEGDKFVTSRVVVHPDMGYHHDPFSDVVIPVSEGMNSENTFFIKTIIPRAA